MFVRPPQDLDATNVYTFTHPPQAWRMNCVMEQGVRWCKQNRPGLVEWMTPDRFQILMRSAAEATWGMNGGKDWSAQIAFLRSADGAEYTVKFGTALKDYVHSL